MNHFGGFCDSHSFSGPLLRPCKVQPDVSPGGPTLPLGHSPNRASHGAARSAPRSGCAVPLGAVSLNLFLASVRILCPSSVLERETSSWILSSYVGWWVRKIVSISLIMARGSPEYGGAHLCQFNISVEENGW